MSIDIDKLKALAKAATPGPWQADGDDVIPDPNRAEGIIAWCDFAQKDQRDAQYIAAAYPATILALIERVREAKAERNALVAHQADLVRELSACQGVLHSLANSGEVTQQYANEAKAVLKRTKEASLARRDAEMLGEFALRLDREGDAMLSTRSIEQQGLGRKRKYAAIVVANESTRLRRQAERADTAGGE